MINANQHKFTGILALLSIALIGTATAHGQQTTEQYVPIGQSPGISNEYSYIGNIVSVDAVAHTITVDSNRGTRVIKVLNTTRLWLDRSKARKTNTTAEYRDCEVGRKVEVMYEHDDHDAADWIKIEAS